MGINSSGNSKKYVRRAQAPIGIFVYFFLIEEFVYYSLYKKKIIYKNVK